MTDKNHLAGIKIVLTGDFDAYERDEATRALEALGAAVTSAVSGKTTVVIAGREPGATKLGQADKRGLPVLNEAQLVALLGGQRLEEVIAAAGRQPTTSCSPAADDVAMSRVPLPAKAPPPRDGEYVEYHPGTDRIFIAGTYKDGLRHGLWKKYFPSGQLQEDYGWVRGLPEGPELDWNASGIKLCAGTNRAGKRCGTWTWWYENGAYRHTLTYDEQGRRQGPLVDDAEDGNPAVRGQWLDDQYHGRWTWWNSPQWEVNESGYHRGSRHGSERTVHRGGQTAIVRSWYRGKRHGLEERFDATGRLIYKGDWCYGHPVGEHTDWQSGNPVNTNFIAGLPDTFFANTTTHDKIVNQLAQAHGAAAKVGAFAHVLTDYRAAALLYLWRTGRIDVVAEPDLWEVLADAAGLLRGAEVVEFLRQVKNTGPYSNILPYLPADLDRIVMEVYQRDPAPLDAAWESLPVPMYSVLALVRARCGRDIGTALHNELPGLVKNYVAQHGFGDVLWPDELDVLTLQPLFADSHGTRTALMDRLLAFFGSREQWVAALKQAALKALGDTGARVSLRVFREVIAEASPAELVALIDGIALNNDTETDIQRALTAWRHDDAATTAQIALAVKDTTPRKWPTVATALVRYAAAGSAPPQALVDALKLESESPTGNSSWYTEPLRNLDAKLQLQPAYRVAYIDDAVGAAVPRLKLLQDAMRALPPAQARSVIERELANGKLAVAQYLHVVADPVVWERFLDLAEADPYGCADATLYGVGEIGLRVVPLLTARLRRTKSKEWASAYGIAVVIALARSLSDGEQFPAELDTFVRFDIVKEESTWRAYAPFVERILCKLPLPRATAILLRGLSSSSLTIFARAFASIACCPSTQVCAKAFTELLHNEHGLEYDQHRAVCSGVAALHNGVDWVRWFRQSGGGGVLGPLLKQTLGTSVYEALDKELDAAGVPPPTTLDQIDVLRRRAKKIGGKGERIYLLRTVDLNSASAAVKKSLNRIGAAAPGVDAARWPCCSEGPLVHLFTLDVNTMPELRTRVGAEVRAISLFCWNPQDNQAYEPGTERTAVVFTTEAQLQQTATPPQGVALDEESRFEAVPVEVSSTVWSRKSELKNELYDAAARVLGRPIWLQYPEKAAGPFLMQFDDNFIPMNLGDSGIMYVFGGTAFWQCH